MNAMTRVRRTPSALAYLACGFCVLGAVVIAFVAVELAINPPQTRSVLAQTLQQKKASSGEVIKAARDALTDTPLDVRAVRVLGLNAWQEGDKVNASRLMAMTERLSKRDLVSNAWLFDQARQNGNLSKAVSYGDLLLRQRPELAENLNPALLALAQTPEGAAALGDSLSLNPSWRVLFMNALIYKGDPAAAFAVLNRLNQTSGPPTDAESSGYLLRLVSMRLYEQAQLSWFLLSPPSRMAGYQGLYDGDFAGLSGPQPFNWTLAMAAGAQVGMEAAPDRPHDPALHLIYGGLNAATLASQTIVLPPGDYTLNVQTLLGTQPPAAVATRLQWTVSCLEDNKLVSSPAPAGKTTWTTLKVQVTIPETGCKGQSLSLRAAPSDRSDAVDAWYDKITIKRDDTQL